MMCHHAEHSVTDLTSLTPLSIDSPWVLSPSQQPGGL